MKKKRLCPFSLALTSLKTVAQSFLFLDYSLYHFFAPTCFKSSTTSPTQRSLPLPTLRFPSSFLSKIILTALVFYVLIIPRYDQAIFGPEIQMSRRGGYAVSCCIELALWGSELVGFPDKGAFLTSVWVRCQPSIVRYLDSY